MRAGDGDKAATCRPGQWRAEMDYDSAYWRDHSIRAARFAPCPHCGSAVSGRERTLSAAHRFGPEVFRRAECKNPECGWAYQRTGGTRDGFVAAVNRRSAGAGGQTGERNA